MDSVLLCIQLALAALPVECPDVVARRPLARAEQLCAPAVGLLPSAQPEARADLVKYAQAVARIMCVAPDGAP